MIFEKNGLIVSIVSEMCSRTRVYGNTCLKEIDKNFFFKHIRKNIEPGQRNWN